MIAARRPLLERRAVPDDLSPHGIYALLSFKNIHFFPIIVVAGLYGAQSVVGYARFQDQYSLNMLAITSAACLFYYFSYRFIFSKIDLRKLVNRQGRIRLRFSHFAIVILALYAALIIYTTTTANAVALFSALRGAGLTEIADQREAFLRTRTGWEASLKYLYAICTTSVVPYIVSTLFFIRHKLRIPILCLFLFALMLTLEKSLAIMGLFPLVVLFANQKARKRSMVMTLVLVTLLLTASYLAMGGFRWSTSDTSTKQFHFGADYTLISEANYSILGFVVNRVSWIPYMTAYDWLRFQNDVLGGRYTFGDSISVISAITGNKYIPLERAVFAYEWGGQNATGTGSSNTVYFIDAFLNFGWAGPILYSILLAFIVSVTSVTDNIPARATVYVPLIYLSCNSMTAVLLSGGLGTLLLIIFFLYPVAKENHQKDEKRLSYRRAGIRRAERLPRLRGSRVFPNSL